CVDVIHLPEAEQKKLRRGIKNGNKIFKKGKSEVLTYKNAEVHAKAAPAPVTARVAGVEVVKTPKSYLGKGAHYFPKAKIGQFLLEEGSFAAGDRLLIKGPTTGHQMIQPETIF